MQAEDRTLEDRDLQFTEIRKEIHALNDEAWKIHISKPRLGLELSSKALSLSEQIGDLSGQAYATRNMGVSHRYLSNLEDALMLSLKALEMFQELKDKNGEAQSLVSIAAIFYYMGNYERALDLFLHGLQLGEEVMNVEATTYGYNGAGYLYSVLGQHEKGLEFLQKASALVSELKNFELESSILDSLAVAYINDNQIDKAYDTYLTCMRLCEKHGEKRNLGYSHYGIGEIFLKQQKLDEAEKHFAKSLEIHKSIEYKTGVSGALLQLGKIALEKHQFEDAREYLEKSLTVAEEIKAKAWMYRAHEAFSTLFELKEDFSQFSHHFKLFHQFKAEVFRDEQETKQKYLTLQHDIDKLKQETEINRLTNVVLKEKNEELEKKTIELGRSYESVSVLSKIGRDITSTLNLENILNTVYENVNELMDATVFGIGIYNPENRCIEYQMSIEKGKRYQPYTRSMEDKNQFPVWCIENKKEVFINDIHEEYSKYLPEKDLTILSSAAMEDGSLPESPNSLIYLPLLVKDEVIGILSTQSYKKNAYTSNDLNMLNTLASYTAAALYNAQSFETLQRTLEELKMTQTQLIQQEKMASLGELTAGIAHEIQNPLNFVNNFSEVSTELIEEMEAAIKKGEQNEVIELSEDLKQNLEKIAHHGERASAIVKSMLLHSRAEGGKKEMVDINNLADEYFRLAYHGMRAKDKSFNVAMKTDFDDSLQKIELVPQDIGRVILNLITNAFYAVSDKKKDGGNGFAPEVSVATRKTKNFVEISVKDNGNGVPEHLIDKIFQPFFTTKPTGEGTGLGLSLSYDILKAHGGDIKMKSENGKGTEFTIQLPN